MDGSATGTDDRKALRRIVALLLALAALAERAGRRSGPIRHLVLGVLRSGEAIARDFVCALAHDAGRRPAPAAHTVTGDGEARRLAASFRALAMVLAVCAGVLATTRPPVTGPQAIRVSVAALAGFPAGPVPIGRLDSS